MICDPFLAGHLTVISLRKVFESLGDITFSDEELRSLIHEVDLDMSSTIDLEEFLKVSQLTSSSSSFSLSEPALSALLWPLPEHATLLSQMVW